LSGLTHAQGEIVVGIGSKPLPNLANLLGDDIHKTHTIVSHAGQDFPRVADNFCKGAPHQMGYQLQVGVVTSCV